MLDSLYQLCDSDRLIDDPAFEWARIAWTVEINRECNDCSYISHRYLPQVEEGSKKKPKEQINQMEVPRLFNPETGGTRTSGDFSYFLVDKSEYALGAKPDDPANVSQTDEKIKNRHSLFIQKVRECLEATDCDQVKQLLAFLEYVHENGLPKPLPEKCVGNDLFAFRVASEIENHVHDDSVVREYWKGICLPALGDESPRNCLITGAGMDKSGLFPTVKRVPGGSTSGAGLVSFNAKAFESYGWKGNENASISPLGAIKASTALARLMEPDFRNAEGEKLPSLRRNIAEDTAFVFWSNEANTTINLLDAIDESISGASANPQRIHSLFRALWGGAMPPEIEKERFLALVVSGAQGRIMIRTQIETSVGKLHQCVEENARNLENTINTAPPKKTDVYPPVHGISAILKSCINPKSRKGIPAPMGTAMIRAVYQGFPYPTTMLARALEHERAEIFNDEWSFSIRRDSRAAFFKAFLIRNSNKTNLYPIMHPKNDDIPYLYGRLFACYGEMQRLAHFPRTVNAGLIEKFFSSFMTYPNQVIKNLEERYAHNRRRALRNHSKPWVAPTAASISATITKIYSAIDPDESGPNLKKFTLEDQALFVLGFHHQQHWNTLNKEKRKEYLVQHGFDPFAPDLIISSIKEDETKTDNELQPAQN